MNTNADKITVREVVSLYVKGTEGEGNPRARADTNHVLDIFLADFGDRPLFSCRKGELRQWLKDQARTRKLSGWSVYRWCRTIQRVFNWAVKEDGIIPANPFTGVSFPTGKRGEAMSDEHFKAAMSAAIGPFRYVLFFQRLTGARPGEMASLQWDFILWEKSLAVLREHKTAHSTGKARILRLHPKVIRLLRFLQQQQEQLGIESPHVFLNKRRRPWTRNALVLRMMGVRRRAGLPKGVRLYGLRHSFATQLAVKGVSAAQIAELLGHQDIRMSQTYVHLNGEFPELLAVVENAIQ
jgi:integrase